ncbi:Pre-mRNA-splicing factor of RES complex [Musa troglodytarum]|uniref:Pre-mRNA-splicing factor of RES complex n=1 Tax=Musa troglodytarum TaxID=320322 RepID=A0A9E7FGX6_9LILI|nr:Pre-mRNA-splicing factor of RES complex [Musa troglodytarum]
MAAVPTSNSSALSLKDYLRRYETGADDQKKKKNKKKKEKPQSRTVGGILVVDEDPVWQKPVQIEQEESEPSGDEKPQIEEDVEVKRMKRLDAIRARKPYHAISEDGSGWVSISDPSKTSKSAEIGRDICPPRQGRARFDTPSPEPKEKPSGSQNSDLSPPRQRRRRADTPSPEPEKAVAGDGTADISPPRRRSRDDNSPPRRTRPAHSPVPDLSPPRRSQKDLSDDPKVSSREQEPVDLSPPRRRQRVSSPDISLPRRTRRLSPDAGGPRASDDADLSPPRKSSKCLSDDLSPRRRICPQSPEAIRRQSSPVADLSPQRKSRKEAPSAKESRRAGLFSAKEIKEEIERKKKEDTSRFASMDPFLSGRGAEPVFRDKEGKRISKEEMLKTQEEEKPKEKKLEWGKGLAQKREAEANAKELELEREKPFARTRDDPELDKMLKERIRWGDPMAHLVKRKSSDLILEDLGDNEKMKESGFIIPQTIPSHSWLKRGIDFPPNRYGIKPGRHWDGVDRSNGFEKELFKRQNEKRATEQEAYLWSVSDM